MVYIAPYKLPIKQKDSRYFFLAGSIDYREENPWRVNFYRFSSNKLHFFDPTRKDHDALNNAQMQEHINWELDALELSDKIILNFLPESKSPISLVELGLYAKSGKLIVVCPKEFYQKRYIKTLCKKYRIKLHNSLDEVVF